MLSVASAFLESGEDPNEDMTIDFGRKYRCKPLHIANVEMLEILLRYGADVNGLDERGRTALDISVGLQDDIQFVVAFSVRVSRILILLDNGGCATQAGKDKLGSFMDQMEVIERVCYGGHDR